MFSVDLFFEKRRRRDALHKNRQLLIDFFVAFTVLVALTLAPLLADAQVNSQSEHRAPLPKVFGDPSSVRAAPALGVVSDRIDIIVPRGRRNVEPRLSLSYASMGGLDVVGVGWQLEIGQVMHWRGDGTPTVADPNIYSYSLAGAGGELHETNPGEYRARIEGIYRVLKQVDTDSDGLWDAWETGNGEGALHRFGSTDDSRVEGRLWLLDLVQDRNGNTITFSYDRVNNVLYPTEIRYTGYAPTGDPGRNSIQFEYEDRPEVRISYGNFVREVQSRRLRRISIFAGDELVRRYELEYIQSPVSNQSLLSRIVLVGSDDQSRITLRTLEYSERELGWEEAANADIPLDFAYKPKDDWVETGTRVMDVNGDGFADLVGNGEDVYLGDGQGSFDRSESWSESLQAANIMFVRTDENYWGGDKGVRLVDVNTDGRPDIFIAEPERREVWLNTGCGWSYDTEWTGYVESLQAEAATDQDYLDPATPDFSEDQIVNLSSLTALLENHPEQFSVAHFTDLESLAAQLEGQAEAVSQYLWGVFSNTTRQLISDYNDDPSSVGGLQVALADEFNAVIGGASIYDEMRFELVALSGEAEWLLQQSLSADSLLRLNRVLLEDAYPTSLAKSHSAPDGVSHFLWDSFSPGTRQLISDYNSGSAAGQNVRVALATEFNLIISGPSIYVAPRFEGVSLPGSTDSLLVTSPEGEWLRRLNRLLLESAYPTNIETSYETPDYTEPYNNEVFALVENECDAKGVMLSDVNGDGRIDILWSLDRGGELYWQAQRIPVQLRTVFLGTDDGWITSGGLREELFPFLFVEESQLQGYSVTDVNADGLGDIVQTLEGEQGVYLGTGTGWVKDNAYSQSLVDNGIISLNEDREGQGLIPVDLNDDNLVDYLLANESETRAFRNTGTQWVEDTEMAGALPVGIDFSEPDVVIGDVDGDRFPDIIKARDGEAPRLWLSSRKFDMRADLLVRATSALGEVTEIEWAYSTIFDNRYHSGICDMEIEGLPNPMPLVTEIRYHDGRGNTYTTGYDYSGGKFEDRQYRGFEKVTQLLSNGSYLTTEYHQQEGLTGQFYLEETYDAHGQLRMRRTSDYDVVPVAPGIWQTRLNHTEREIIDTQGNTRSSASYTYNDRLNYISVLKDPDMNLAGDEITMEYSWVRNDDAWIWSLPWRVVSLGPDDSIMTETIMYYDGLPEGQASVALVSEIEELVQPGIYVSKYMWYDGYGNVVRVRDRTGNDTWLEYDGATNTFRTGATDPEGREVGSEYDPRFGALVTDIDASGNISTREYDPFGRLTRICMPGDEESPSGTRTINYSDLGDAANQYYRTSETELPGEPGTLDTKHFFDGRGLIYRTEREGSADRTVITLNEFDDKGNPTKNSRPFYAGETPPWSSIERDALHRPIRIVEPDGIPVTITYAGPVVTVVDRLGSTSSFRMNGDAKVVDIRRQVDATLQITQYSYDVLGRLTGIVDALGEATNIAYDALGRRVRLEDPAAGTFTYTYDGEGRLTEQTAPDGGITRFEYNRSGDLTRKVFPDYSAIQYVYGVPGQQNAVGRITRIIDGAGIMDLKYNARGKVVERRRQVLGQTYFTGYQYDSRELLRWVCYPDGFEVNYHYDSGGSLYRVTDQAGRVIAGGMDYNAAGQLLNITYGNGVQSGMDYDQLMRMTSIRTNTAANDVLQSLDYTYDPDGNILSIADGAFGTSQTFQYDDIGRLLAAEGAYGEEIYEYDAIGGLTRMGSRVFTSDPTNRQRVIEYADLEPGEGDMSGELNIAQSFSIAYDARGNMIAKGDRRFDYDYENQLISVTDKYGHLIEENVYGADGHRVIQRTPQGGTVVLIDGIYEQGKNHVSRHVQAGPLLIATVITPSTTVQLIEDIPRVGSGLMGLIDVHRNSLIFTLACLLLFTVGWLSMRYRVWKTLLAMINDIGNGVRRRPCGSLLLLLLIPAIINATMPQPVFGAEPSKTESQQGYNSENRYYYHSNHLGSINVVTDDMGKVVERRDYKPYGERYEFAGPHSGPRELLFTFGGHRGDDGTGLYYMGARHYDPELGRFLTVDTQVPDPMNPKTLHRYAFAGGNPIRYSDPTGHGFFDWLIYIFVVVVAIVVAVAITICTFGLGAPALVGTLVALTLAGAVLGAGIAGAVALARGESILNADFWSSMASGALLGAMVGAGVVLLPASIFGGPATAIIAGMILGAVFAGVTTTAQHFANGGTIENLVESLFTEAALVSALVGVGIGLISGAGFAALGDVIADAVFTIVSAAVPIIFGAYTGENLPFWLGVPDLNWFFNSPRKNVGVPAWALSGTWPGMAANRGQSAESAALLTMPYAP